MQTIIDVLGCGTLYMYPNNIAVAIYITSFKDITHKILPLFQDRSLEGGKLQDYLYWIDIHKLMSEGSHLTRDGLDAIMIFRDKKVSGRYTER
jgi:hypothetical protein